MQPKPWVQREHIDRTIVEIETDCGVVGIGETRGTWSAKIINERFAPALSDMPVLDRYAVRERCLDRAFDHGFPERLLDLTAFAGVELALWDLAGKEAGLPIFRLLGEPARERAAFCAYGYPPDPSDGWGESDVPKHMAELARLSVDRTGATLFEFKVARHSLACDIETVHAVREAVGPDVEIAVDANMSYDIEQARDFLSETRTAKLANVEEPVERLAEMARLRLDMGTPVSSHCTLFDAISAYPAIDSIVFDLHSKGGIEPAIGFVKEVTSLGKGVWLRAAWELGVSFAAMCHLSISLPELSRPSQALMDFPEDDLIEGAPWQIVDGGCRPPETPGLGVELDRGMLEKYRVP